MVYDERDFDDVAEASPSKPSKKGKGPGKKSKPLADDDFDEASPSKASKKGKGPGKRSKPLADDDSDAATPSKRSPKGKGPGKKSRPSPGHSVRSPPLHTQHDESPKASSAARHKEVMRTQYIHQGTIFERFTDSFERAVALQEDEVRLKKVQLLTQGGRSASGDDVPALLPSTSSGSSGAQNVRLLIKEFLRGMDPATKAVAMAAIQEEGDQVDEEEEEDDE